VLVVFVIAKKKKISLVSQDKISALICTFLHHVLAESLLWPMLEGNRNISLCKFIFIKNNVYIQKHQSPTNAQREFYHQLYCVHSQQHISLNHKVQP
jgi:hypothetical protein